MRHGKKINHLSRTKEHRKALLTNMASSLIMHKRINTTLAKAKALRVYIEPVITKSKNNTTHSRRIVFGYLQDKYAVKELFGEVAGKVADRPGGYTRILKTGNRLGDNAETAIIELVDYNEYMLAAKEDKAGKSKSRRSRRGKGAGAKAKTAVENTEETLDEATEEVKVEEKIEETPAVEAKEKPKAEAKTKEVKGEATKVDDTKTDGTEK